MQSKFRTDYHNLACIHLTNGAPQTQTQLKHEQVLNCETIVKDKQTIRTENHINRLHIQYCTTKNME